jgi:mRNA interferase MazF
VKGYPLEVVLPPGAKVAGAILCDQLESLDWRAREAKKFDVAPHPVLGDVVARIATLTG